MQERTRQETNEMLMATRLTGARDPLGCRSVQVFFCFFDRHFPPLLGRFSGGGFDGTESPAH